MLDVIIARVFFDKSIICERTGFNLVYLVSAMAGSIGLFIILAIIMGASRKIHHDQFVW